MPDFDIVTYCSGSYMEAFDAHIRSWLKHTKAKNIYVYSDEPAESFHVNNSRVVIKPFYKKCDNWITNVGRKTKCILDYLEKTDRKYFAFIEMDCFIVSDFSEVFDPAIDISITRLFSTESYTHATITCGVWFAQVTPKLRQFMKQWHAASRSYMKSKIGITPSLIAYDQLSFTDMIRPAYVNQTFRVKAIDEHIYNCEHTKSEELLKQIETETPKIIHFKGKRFKNKKHIQAVFNVLYPKK